MVLPVDGQHYPGLGTVVGACHLSLAANALRPLPNEPGV